MNEYYRKTPYEDSPANAEIERLVAKLDSLSNGKKNRITLVTSALTGEGKSTVAALVARSTAFKLNKPTLLIDFDVRRPTSHNIFQLKRERGLVDVLSLNLTIRSCLKQTSIPNLAVLTSGRSDADPNDLLKTDKIRMFLKGVGAYFTNIIIDSPPVIPVSDPLVLAKLVDHIVLVVKAGETPRSLIKRAINMFADINAEVTGLVMNNLDSVMPYQYDYRYYGYQYEKSSQ